MASNHEVDGSATVPRVNRKDVAWLRSLARGELAEASFYRKHPQHDHEGRAATVREERAAHYEKIAAYLDATLPRRGKRSA